MAGLDDYEFYTNLRGKDSPFWQKDMNFSDDPRESRRPSDFPERLNPPIQKASVEQSTPVGKDVPLEKYGEVSFTVISLCAENLLSHPFIVLKRQCQVNVSSQRYHLFPFTLVPCIIHLQGHQGFSAMWKGLGSVLTVRGLTLALEDFISKFSPWPKEISPHSSLKSIGQHLLLKCSALALITPFYSASLVETVQSEITSEKPGILDVFKEGLYRLLSFTQPQTGRMLPVWLLIIPTVAYGVTHYVIGNSVSSLSTMLLRNNKTADQRKQGAISKDLSLYDSSVRLQATFVGHLTADILLYPFETILHRMHLQGTRTIIDSLDIGYEVKPILTRYEGFFDCFSTILKEEGTLGLFKGFGALCLQYAMYGAVLKFAHVIIREITLILVPPKPKNKPQDHVTPLTPGAPYTQISSLQPGGSSLHSSPIHSSRRNYPGYNEPLSHAGSVDLGELTSSSYELHGSARKRMGDIDFKRELAKHKANLAYDD